MADLNKALELDPKSSDAHAARARLHNAEKNFEKALEDASKAIELDATNPLAYAQRALSFRNLGREKEADTDIAKARSLGWSE